MACLHSCFPADQPLAVQEQEKKSRIRGIEAQKANIKAAKAVARILQSSLGPKGMDKMLQSPDGDVCISDSRRDLALEQACWPCCADLLVLREY